LASRVVEVWNLVVSGWTLRIGELAELAGVSTRTLRHYEDLGALAPPGRSKNGYRTYPASALADVIEIRHLQSAGLSLQEAAAVRRDRAIGQESSMLARLTEAQADLDTELEQLIARRTALRQLRAALADGDPLLASREQKSFGPVAEQLRRLGVSDRAIAEQRRAWAALSAVRLPTDWQEVVTAGLSQLERSPTIEGLAEVLDLVASLRGVDPLDPTVTAVAERVARFVVRTPSAQGPMSLAGPSALPILAVVASCFTSAQIAALLHVIKKMREPTRPKQTSERG
jgi:DNA-binding transcriptional MerR regulator